MKLVDVKRGDKLKADGGFTCISPGAILEVFASEGQAYVSCADGKHYLDGQQGDDGELIGFAMHHPGEQPG